MPCSDNPSQCDTQRKIRESKSIENANLQADLSATKEKLHQTEAMLCAMCNEATISLMRNAEDNGKCKDIKMWFKAHRKKDIQKLIKGGLPLNPSQHELNLYNKLFS